MSYKVGLILSTVFIALFFCFGIDLLTIQFTYSDLEAKSTSISYQISKHGSLDSTFVETLMQRYKIQFVCNSNCSPLFGDVVNYTISKQIETIVISEGPMTISLNREAIIGYFG